MIYEVQIHYENKGMLTYKKKMDESNDLYMEALESFSTFPNETIFDKDIEGTVYVINLSKVTGILLKKCEEESFRPNEEECNPCH